MRSIMKFSTEIGMGESLSLEDLSVVVIERYQRMCLDNNNSISTVRSYLRCLRALFNDAIDKNLINRNIYPFGRKRYVLGASVASKKNLSTEQLIELYDFNGAFGERAKDFWWFSFYCNGANAADLISLTVDNISGDKLIFIRRKTEFGQNGTIPIQVALNDEMKAIIKKYANQTYLLGVYKPGMKQQQREEVMLAQKRLLNRSLNRIGKRLGFPLNMSMARNSAATQMYEGGIEISQISSALGHANAKTTEIYLGSLSDKAVKERAQALHGFKEGSKRIEAQKTKELEEKEAAFKAANKRLKTAIKAA